MSALQLSLPLSVANEDSFHRRRSLHCKGCIHIHWNGMFGEVSPPPTRKEKSQNHHVTKRNTSVKISIQNQPDLMLAYFQLCPLRFVCSFFLFGFDNIVNSSSSGSVFQVCKPLTAKPQPSYETTKSASWPPEYDRNPSQETPDNSSSFPEAPSEVLVTNSADVFSFVCFLVLEEIKSRQAPIFWKTNQARTEMHLSRMRCLKRLYQTD